MNYDIEVNTKSNTILQYNLYTYVYSTRNHLCYLFSANKVFSNIVKRQQTSPKQTELFL